MTMDEIEMRRRRAAYRAAHRGTKEMDWFIGRFAAAALPAMDGERLDVFERLLALPDPDIEQWLREPATVAGREFAGLIGEVRAFHGLDATTPLPKAPNEWLSKQ